MVAEIQDKMNLRDKKFEKLFIDKTIMKINNDFTGDSAAKKSEEEICNQFHRPCNAMLSIC